MVLFLKYNLEFFFVILDEGRGYFLSNLIILEGKYYCRIWFGGGVRGGYRILLSLF